MMSIMKPTSDLVKSIYLDKVLRAREESIEQKLLDGPRLFAFACEAARAGIRADHPNATPEQVNEVLRARFTLIEKLEESSRG